MTGQTKCWIVSPTPRVSKVTSANMQTAVNHPMEYLVVCDQPLTTQHAKTTQPMLLDSSIVLKRASQTVARGTPTQQSNHKHSCDTSVGWSHLLVEQCLTVTQAAVQQESQVCLKSLRPFWSSKTQPASTLLSVELLLLYWRPTDVPIRAIHPVDRGAVSQPTG